MPAESPTALRRSLGLLHATSMVVGTILGASIFVQPSEIGLHVPNPSHMMMIWVAAGLLTLYGAMICARLSARYPQTGGVYIFLKELFSPAVAFLWGWAMFWSVHSGIIAAMSMIAARYVGYFVPLGDFGIRVTAIACILALSAVNYVGVRAGSTLQLVLTAAKLLAIVAILILLFSFATDGNESGWTAAPLDTAGYQKVVLALVAGLFSFGGWHMVTYVAGETRDAGRIIPRALLLGTAIVTAVYVAMNLAYLRVLPVHQVINSTRVAADAAEHAVGAGAAGLISALVVISTVGALTGIILAGPRMYYAMARDGLAFRWLAAVHPEFQTPHRAIVAQAVWASVLVATGTYRELFTRVIYTEWIFFGLLGVGVMRFQQRSHSWWARTLDTWPLLFVAASLLIVINQVSSDWRSSLIGLGFVIAGLPVYFLWARKREA